MSELAFNVNGERFDPDVEASGWRVRRLKPGGRGTPTVVFGDDGAPLTIDMDTDLAEFRRQVRGAPGRYRLDPINEEGRAVDGGSPAYLTFEDEVAVSTNAPAPSASAELDVIRELVRVNSEMVHAITDKFATVMDSAAGLIRAADGAGIPARKPLVLEPAAVAEAELEDEDDVEEDEHRNSPAAHLMEMVAQLAPLVQMVMSRNKASTPSPAPRNAAPAEEEPEDTVDDDACDEEEPSRPTLTPSQMTHFVAVQAKLKADERQLAEAVAKELGPRELSAWIEQLTTVSVDGAVDLIRQTIASCEAKDAS